MKKCSKCKVEKDLNLFPKNINGKDGYCVQCKQCKNEYRKINQHKYREAQQVWNNANPDKIIEYRKAQKTKLDFKKNKAASDKKYREKKADQLKVKKQKYYLENKQAIANKKSKHYQENKEQIKKRISKWRKENAAAVNAIIMRRYANKLNATPSWLTEDDHWLMKEAYELARLRTKMFGFVWHVDHVIPLQGKKVCGLHVPLNLQVIPASVNCSKGNKFEL
jgi:hypothetical protein